MHLCLYDLSDGDRSSEKLPASNVVPWLLAWLVFSEVWLVSGVWLAGGVDAAQPGPAAEGAA